MSEPIDRDGRTSRAVVVERFGGPEELRVRPVPVPRPGPGEVLVRAVANSVNPADWKRREGMLPAYGEPPFVPGLDFSGVVEAVGEGVTGRRVGEEVIGDLIQHRGSYADHVLAPAAQVGRAPAGVDLETAAAIPTAGLTAWQALVRGAQVAPGMRVLVHAGAGGVGHFAVQVAAGLGAHVVTTARAVNHDFLRSLGAAEVVDHTRVDFTTAVAPVDVVLDPLSDDVGLRSLEVLRPGGILVDVRGTGGERDATAARAEATGKRFAAYGHRPSGADLEIVGSLVTPHVAAVFPLEEAAEAHRRSATGRVRGKLVLTRR